MSCFLILLIYMNLLGLYFFPLSRVENIYNCLVSFVDHRMEDAIGDALNGRSPSNLTSGIF